MVFAESSDIHISMYMYTYDKCDEFKLHSFNNTAFFPSLGRFFMSFENLLEFYYLLNIYVDYCYLAGIFV
jgi:hypothetical protein